LKKLGLGLDENYLKTASNDQIIKDLTATYGNFSENQAKTAEARFRSMSIAIEESKEAIGAALLPVAEKLAAFVLETLIPALDGFIAGLTGNEGLKASLTESQKNLFAWGERVRNIIKTIVDLKEELTVIGTVIAGIFVASKIAGFITVIQGLVSAFIAWRTAAAGAAVATAAATGGVSLGAAAAGIAGAIGLFAGAGIFLNRAGGDGGGSTETGALGNYQMSTGTILGSTGGGGGAGGGGGFGGGGGAGGGGGSSIMTPSGATSAKNLVERLTSINEKFSDLQFLVDTGGISKSAGLKQLDALTKEFKVLENQANALTTPSSSFDVGSFRRGEAQSMVTINMGIVGDPEGAARAVEQVFQDSSARGGIVSTVGAFSRL